MTTGQKIVLMLAAVLFAGLYFGFSTKRPAAAANHGMMKPDGGSELVSADFSKIIGEGRQKLSPQQNEQIEALEKLVAGASTVAEKTALMKKLAGLWYKSGQVSASATVAWSVAESEKSDSAWSVAGASFFEALQNSDGENRQFFGKKSAEAFGNAAAANPKNVEHAVNQALVWAEVPPQDNPMKAALSLRELAEKHPDAPAPFNALGRLAIKTGQWQKAVERLEHSWSLDKNNPNTPCLLALAYQNLGNAAKSSEFGKLCKK